MPDNDAPKLDRNEHPFVFSASQIETAMLCFRKWAFDKIDRLPREETEATALGSEVHDHLEKYLKYGTPIDTSKNSGKIAMSGIQHMPPPMAPGMQVEEWFVRKSGLATYWGKKDYQFLGGYWGLPLPIVGDHKTCAQFTWAKSEKDLQETVQSGMYGWDAMEDAGKDLAQLRWAYMRTKGAKKSLPVITNISRMQAEDVMARVEDTSQVLIEMHKNLSMGEAIEAEPNFSACEAFGGCPRKPICKPTAASALDAMMTQKTNESVLKGLRSRKNKNLKGAEDTPTKSVEDTTKQREEDKASENEGDKVNPPDRDGEPPPPPSPKKANGKWFQPTWDETEWKWSFPEEYDAAVKEEEEAKKAKEKEEATAKANAAKGKSSTGSKKTTSKKTASSDGSFEAFIDMFADKVADKVAEKLKE
jgi:hypothetical protein